MYLRMHTHTHTRTHAHAHTAHAHTAHAHTAHAHTHTQHTHKCRIPLQAPTILLLMIYVLLYGYVQPFRLKYVNVLEFVFLVDILLLQMIKSTNDIQVSSVLRGLHVAKIFGLHADC